MHEGKAKQLALSPGATVRELKQCAHDTYGIALDRVELVYQSASRAGGWARGSAERVLADDQSGLAAAGVLPDSVVEARVTKIGPVVKAPGGCHA